MANHKSAIKQHRQDLKRRATNRMHKTRLRTAIKHCRKAFAEGNAEQAQTLLTSTLSLLDCTGKHGAMHGNSVSRSKSRLTRAFNKMSA